MMRNINKSLHQGNSHHSEIYIAADIAVTANATRCHQKTVAKSEDSSETSLIHDTFWFDHLRNMFQIWETNEFQTYLFWNLSGICSVLDNFIDCLIKYKPTELIGVNDNLFVNAEGFKRYRGWNSAKRRQLGVL